MLLTATCLWACSDSDDVANDLQNGQVGAVGTYYLRLNLGLGNNTRADEHPYGGPNGDGTEDGRLHENDINDICVFIYTGSGIGDAGTTPIKNKYYFGGLGLTSNTTYETEPLLLSDYMPDMDDRVIVIVNHGDCRSQFNTLADFRSTAWDKSTLWSNNTDPTQCNNFTMSSAIDNYAFGRMILSGKTGGYDNPFTTSIELERNCARVDFWFKDANKDGNMLSYASEDGTGTLKLSHIRLFNMPDAGSTYALKHTTADLSADPIANSILMGQETCTADYIPTNYIFTPTTLLKTADWAGYASKYESGTMLENTLFTTYLSDVNYQTHATDSRVFQTTEGDIDGDGTAEGTVNNYTIGYCTENTMAKEYQLQKYMTGLAVKGTFVPKKVYTWSSGSVIEDSTYPSTGTDAEKMTWLSTHDIWHYVDMDDTNAMNSYYFSTAEAVHKYEESRPAVHHSIDHYVHGECYYYIWIRHAHPTASHATGTFPMEYAIVRNNIYRIGVSKVTTIGTPLPDPDKDPILHSRIYVRKWNLREMPEIVL